MGVKQVKVDVNELTVGMFVSGLDRPWTQTPFPLQGFYIRDLEEIKQLRIHCNFVYIDVVRGSSPVKTKLRKLSKIGDKVVKPKRASKSSRVTDLAPLRVRRDVYTEVQPIEKEIGQAKID